MSRNIRARKHSIAKWEQQQKYQIFNDKYELIKCVGKGYTSDVYMARDIKNPGKLLAIKIYKDDFL